MSKALKPRALEEEENLASINAWKHRLLTYLRQEKKYAEFLEEDFSWEKHTVENRGLEGVDAETRAAALDTMLATIATYASSYLTSQICNTCTCLNDIWQLVRKYYNIKPSESNFLKLLSMSPEPGERHEKFYHRILSHVTDNLLSQDSPLLHDGVKPTADEEISPSLERMVVMLWMEKIHVDLPALVQKTFAYDLQRLSLKDLQPQICDAIDGFLLEINNDDMAACSL